MNEETPPAKLTKRQMGVTFTSRAIDFMHNHKPDEPDSLLYAPTKVEYAGFSRNAPHYHVFKCVAEPSGGTAVVENRDKHRFCTFRQHCKDEEPARWITKDERFASCDTHAKNYNRGPCPWASIIFCRVKAKLDIPGQPPETCSLCDHYERRSA